MILDLPPFPHSPTSGGYLLVLGIIVPVIAMLLILVAGGRYAERIALSAMALGLAVAIAVAVEIQQSQAALVYILGGWTPPLGLALRADGISGAMMLMTALIMGATSLYARAKFVAPADGSEARAPFMFWMLILVVWSGLNCIFLGDDLFNLYVALELLTFSAVPLVCLDGRAETLSAALRYLLFALLGSVLYLLGTAIIYGTYGTLDISILSKVVGNEPAAAIAVGLMTVGLIAKTALFPLHLWLPPAHAGAPPAASAILSALVVKGSFFIIIRLWFDVLPAPLNDFATQFIAVLGAGAIVFGSVLALRQARLKLLIAYSTIAQIGYLFLVFPLAAGGGSTEPWSSIAWTGGMLQLASHAFAKAAMFMAAGLIAEVLGHDRIDGLRGIGKVLPITLFAFGLGGMSLMGLPPSGGFSAKWLMLTASVAEGQWWWAVVILVGGVLAGGYVVRVLAPALGDAKGAASSRSPVSRSSELLVLGVALMAILLGLVPLEPSGFLQIGRPIETELALR